MPSFADTIFIYPNLPRCQLLLIIMLSALGGCATYSPVPLSHGRGTTDAAHLHVSAAAMPVRKLADHLFDPADGLDVTEVAMLAVANNPQLKVKRDALDIARAQAFSAGLLPDPQLAIGVDFPSGSGTGLSKAFNLGLSADVSALLTRSARVASARRHGRQVNLELLWAEWQTVARARVLFDQVQSTQVQEKRLRREATALAPLTADINKALTAGDLTYAGASTGLNALADVRRQLAQTTRQHVQAQHDMRLLLGLAPRAPLNLVGTPYLGPPSTAQIDQALAELPKRRPDLLALQAGYAAQEARVRGTILAQFPAITLGFTRARDTSNVNTHGFSVGITLPLFNRNRGNIAIARATRQQLHDAYSARLLGARSDVRQLQADLGSLRSQLDALAKHAQQLDSARNAATRAWNAKLLDWPTYLAIRNSALAADLELASLRQQRAKQAIALETLLGGDWAASTSATMHSTNAATTSTGSRP